MKRIIALILLVTTCGNAQLKDVFDTARAGSVDEIKLLVQKNKDTINAINAAGFTPLILACYRSNNPVAEYLAQNVKDVNYNSSSGTALAAAVIKGNLEIAKKLLLRKANPNIADAMGVTPLTYAAQFQKTELVKLLLQYKANPLAADKEGKTPYDYAIFTKNDEIINLLKK